MAYGYPYQMQPQPQQSYFNTNYMPNVPMMANAQTPQQTPAQPQSNVSWVYVSGVQGARDHIVQPGQTAWMMDNNEPIIHVKAVDNMGTATLKSFRLTEIAPDMAVTQPQPAETLYATREELAAISAKVDKFISELGGMNT